MRGRLTPIGKEHVLEPFRDWPIEFPLMLDRQEPESLHLDYKAREALLVTPYKSREKRAEEISKDVSAFLNSDGGTIIYGVREIVAGKQRLPVSSFDPQLDGYDSDEMSKEDLENLITSNIQFRPGPDLFCITVVQMNNRYVLVVDIAKSLRGAFQAKDKRYYKRFNFKAEAMEHYEIEDVRRRATGPDLRIVWGLTDTWDTKIAKTLNYQTQNEEVVIHIGLVNRGQAVAETALVELGIHDLNRPPVLPLAYARDRERIIRFNGGERTVPWYRCRWTPQNLGKLYTPLFPAVDPEYLVGFQFQIPKDNYRASLLNGVVLGLIFWRIQAPNMRPSAGIHKLRDAFGQLSIEADPRTLQVDPVP